jgi:DNA-binding transcriptional regulator YiaG
LISSHCAAAWVSPGGVRRALSAAERTLQNYEQRRDTPPALAIILLKLIDREPEIIARILAD